MLYTAGSDWVSRGGNPTIYGYVGDTNIEFDSFGLEWKDLNSSGLGHHLFPRSVARKLGVKKLSVLKAMSWYPNESAGTGVLHQKLHRVLIDEGVPYHGSRFTKTLDDFWKMAEKAYDGIDTKGYLKIPKTDEILFKDLTPKEGIKKIKELYEKGEFSIEKTIPCNH